jgi:uncharacterized NAD(P)/FAD-binding protein YdhS
MSDNALPSIAVVGAGFSALSLLRQLHERRMPAAHVHVFGDGNEFGTGLAYAKSAGHSLLNTRAGDVGLSASCPSEFADWLGLTGIERDTFQTREVFGRYLRDSLSALAGDSSFPMKLAKHRALAITRSDRGFQVRSAEGVVNVDHVVLATGPLPPAPLCVLGADVRASARYVDDPWRSDWSDDLDPHSRIVILGTGLTMVDHAARLRAQGHRAPVVALSRHGWLPRPHPASRLPGESLSDAMLRARDSGSVSKMLQVMRASCTGRDDWAAAFDAIRPHVVDIWQRLTAPERRRFLRHLRCAWEVHRHRMAPELWIELQSWIGEGWLRIVTGRITAATLADDVIALQLQRRDNGANERIEADLLLRATGIDGALRSGCDTLIDSLMDQGLICADPFGLGIAVDNLGHVLDATGQTVPGLYAMGAIARGCRWECTAIPELRQIAGVLVAELARART